MKGDLSTGCHTGPSGTVNIVGIERKLIIMFIFSKAGPHTCFFTKRVCKAVIPTRFFTKRVSKAGIPTRFLGKRVWKIFYSVFLQRGAYLLFFKAGIQSGCGYLLFYKAGTQSGYPYLLFREAGMLHAEYTHFSKKQII